MPEADEEHPIVNHETRIMMARVARTRLVSPHMVEVTLVGDDFTSMPDLGPDAFCYLFVPRDGQERPDVDYDFSWSRCQQFEPEQRPQGRYYTVRRFRRTEGEVDLQMLLHSVGPLSTWAAAAKCGDYVALWGPRAAFKRPEAGVPVLLAADHSGLPALAAILEALPAEATGNAFIELEDEGDQVELAAREGVALCWLTRRVEHRGELLAAAVRGCEVSSETYAWVAADNATVAELRRYLKSERGLPARSVCAIGYWQADPPTERTRNT